MKDKSQAHCSERESLMTQSSWNPGASGKHDAMCVLKREAHAKRHQAYHSGQGSLLTGLSRETRASGKLDAMFPCHNVFRFADQASVGKSLLDGNKDHLLKQDLNELVRQEHQVGALDNCIEELQQQAYAQRLELEDAQHGNIESRREQSRLREESSMKEKVGSPRYSNPKCKRKS